MRRLFSAGGVAAATLVASFMPWGSLTAPITTPGLLHGQIHTFHLTGWNGTVLVPFWVDVLGALGAALLFGVDRNRAAMLLAATVLVHLAIAGSFLATQDKTSVGPGLVVTMIAVGVVAIEAVRSVRARS